MFGRKGGRIQESRGDAIIGAWSDGAWRQSMEAFFGASVASSCMIKEPHVPTHLGR